MLTQERLVAFVWTSDPARARAFYEGVLGLTFAGEHDHLMTFDCGPAQHCAGEERQADHAAAGTAVGWHVADLRAERS